MAFIGVLINEERDDSVPVSVSRDRGAAMDSLVTRVLGMGISDGSVAVIERDLNDAEFEHLQDVLLSFFTEQGIV